MKTQDILPVVLSIIVILLVAVVEKQSKLFAALTATMPLACHTPRFVDRVLRQCR